MIKQTEGFNMTQIDQFHDALQTRCLTWLFTHSPLPTNILLVRLLQPVNM